MSATKQYQHSENGPRTATPTKNVRQSRLATAFNLPQRDISNNNEPVVQQCNDIRSIFGHHTQQQEPTVFQNSYQHGHGGNQSINHQHLPPQQYSLRHPEPPPPASFTSFVSNGSPTLNDVMAAANALPGGIARLEDQPHPFIQNQEQAFSALNGNGNVESIYSQNDLVDDHLRRMEQSLAVSLGLGSAPFELKIPPPNYDQFPQAMKSMTDSLTPPVGGATGGSSSNTEGAGGGRPFVPKAYNPRMHADYVQHTPTELAEKAEVSHEHVLVTRLVLESLADLWHHSSVVLSRPPDPHRGEYDRVFHSTDLRQIEEAYDDVSVRCKQIPSVHGARARPRNTFENEVSHHARELQKTITDLESFFSHIQLQTYKLVDDMYEKLRIAKKLMKFEISPIDRKQSSMENKQRYEVLTCLVRSYLFNCRDRKQIARDIGQVMLAQWPDGMWLIIVGDADTTGWCVWYTQQSHLTITLGDYKVFVADVSATGEEDEEGNGQRPRGRRQKNDLLMQNISDRLQNICTELLHEDDDVSLAAQTVCTRLDDRFGQSFQCVFGYHSKFFVHFAYPRSLPKPFDVRIKRRIPETPNEVEIWRM